MNYTYYYIMNYLPKRYSATPRQLDERNELYSFKDGTCSQHIKDEFCSVIKKIVRTNKKDYVVLFIPASTSMKTRVRYYSLSIYIEKQTGVTSTIEAINNTISFEPMHLSCNRIDHSGSYSIDPKLFNGKRVILIDDVITSGTSFRNVANILMKNAAISVIGLFVSKTVNPDWQKRVA